MSSGNAILLLLSARYDNMPPKISSIVASLNPFSNNWDLDNFSTQEKSRGFMETFLDFFLKLYVLRMSRYRGSTGMKVPVAEEISRRILAQWNLRGKCLGVGTSLAVPRTTWTRG